MNEFKIWFDEQTVGMGRNQRAQYKRDIAERMKISPYILENWMRNVTKPDRMRKIAVNTEMKQCVFQIDEL